MRVRGLKRYITHPAVDALASHPMRVRGLKLDATTNTMDGVVAPHAGAWIETLIAILFSPFVSSHPMRVRGLKLWLAKVANCCKPSHPMRVRGLKQAREEGKE